MTQISVRIHTTLDVGARIAEMWAHVKGEEMWLGRRPATAGRFGLDRWSRDCVQLADRLYY